MNLVFPQLWPRVYLPHVESALGAREYQPPLVKMNENRRWKSSIPLGIMDKRWINESIVRGGFFVRFVLEN